MLSDVLLLRIGLLQLFISTALGLEIQEVQRVEDQDPAAPARNRPLHQPAFPGLII